MKNIKSTLFVVSSLVVYTSNAFPANYVLPLAIGVGATLATIKETQHPSNTGTIDYAFVSSEYQKGIGCIELKPKFLSKSGEAGLLPVKRKDVYEVTLKHIKLAELPEGSSLPRQKIAVLVKGFEMAGKDETVLTDDMGFDFSSESSNLGRIVYYSDDVKPGQALNFGQLNMFGPLPYQGHPVGVTVYVLKLADDIGPALKPLLGTIAQIGKTVSPLNASGIGMLESIGSRLLEGSDEVLFRYDTTLRSSDGTVDDLAFAHLAYGDYVLLRTENRTEKIDWKQFLYNPQNGKLYKNTQKINGECKDGPQGNEVSEHSYGVIQINKARNEAAAYYAEFSGFRKNIAEAVNKAAETEYDIASAVQEASKPLIQSRKFKRFADSIENYPNVGATLQQQESLRGALAGIYKSVAISLHATQHKSELAPIDANQADLLIGKIREKLGSAHATNLKLSSFDEDDANFNRDSIFNLFPK